MIDENKFYDGLRVFLVSQRPDLDGEIDPATELWASGYLDSFALIETITYLEEIVGHPIEIGADDLSSFATMKDMYKAFIAG